MLKSFFSLCKKILFNVLFLYRYNMVVAPIGLIIPINFITIGSLTLLGIPALFGFILISVLLF